MGKKMKVKIKLLKINIIYSNSIFMGYISKTGKRKTKRDYVKKYGTKSGYAKKKYNSRMRDYLVKSTPIKTPFPDEFICKVKSFVKFEMEGLGSTAAYSDAKIYNSLATLGQYETGAGLANFYPIGGVNTQEGITQLNAMYNNYVVSGIKVELNVENNNQQSLLCFTFPYYPGTNLTGPTLPFGTVEDDPRVKKIMMNPITQGTKKYITVKRYITPQYAFNNGYIKGDKGWSALVTSDPSYYYGLGLRVASVDRVTGIGAPVIVTGYITHYCKFFNKKNV